MLYMLASSKEVKQKKVRKKQLYGKQEETAMNIMPLGDYYAWYCEWCDSRNLTLWTKFEKNEVLYWLVETSILKQDYRSAVGYVDRLKGDPILYPKGLSSLGWFHFQKLFFYKWLAKFPLYNI